MNKFSFEPVNGLLDENVFPNNPSTGQEARGQIQTPLTQIKDFINSSVVEYFNKENEKIHESSGYQRFSNGLLLQWGIIDLPANTSSHDYNFKKPFTNCFIAIPVVMDSNNSSGSSDCRLISYNNSIIRVANSTSIAMKCVYVAIGI